MRLSSLLVLASFMLALVACDPPDTELLDETDLAITNVSVLPMTSDEVLENQTVVVRDGVITELGPAGEIEIREAVETVDGEGLYLMPGLAEMHAHLPGDDDPEGIVDDVLTLFVANGVTFARGMLGAELHLQLREEIAAGDRFGPRLRVGSPFLSGGQLETPDNARDVVRGYAEQGYDFLKMGEGLEPDVFDAVVEEAGVHDIPFSGHVPDAVGLERAMEAGQLTVDHLENFIEAMRTDEAPEDFSPIMGVAQLIDHVDEGRLDELVALAEQTGTGQVPTMLVWERFFGDTPPADYPEQIEEVRYLPANMVDGWVNQLENIRDGHTEEQGAAVRDLRHDILRALANSDTPILLGSDAPQMFNVPGFSIHDEMAFMQDEIGMSPFEVLYSGTRAIAEFYGQETDYGAVEVGLRADLVLTTANPLDDVANARDVAGVVLNGEWYSGTDLQEMLQEIEERWARDDA